MKTLFLTIFTLFLVVQSYAQYRDDAPRKDDKFFYLAKAEKYHRMKNTGTILTVGGSVAMIVGMVTLLNSADDPYTNGQPAAKPNDNVVFGAVAYIGGAACLGAGIPLWIVGGVSEGKYRRKFENVNVSLKLNQQRAGFSLTYRF